MLDKIKARKPELTEEQKAVLKEIARKTLINVSVTALSAVMIVGAQKAYGAVQEWRSGDDDDQEGDE